MKLKSLFLSMLAQACCLSNCLALGMVDQQYAPSLPILVYTNVGADNDIDWSQTFTVGRDGQLIGFDAWIYRYPELSLPLLYDIRHTTNASPTESDSGSSILISGMVAAYDVPIVPPTNVVPDDVLQITFQSPVSVNAGDVLAITFRSDDPGVAHSRWTYSWIGNYHGTLQGGAAFVRVGTSFANPTDGWAAASSNMDLGFTTYLAAIPEPRTLSLSLIAALGVCLLRRR